jgi:hypothetical protein
MLTQYLYSFKLNKLKLLNFLNLGMYLLLNNIIIIIFKT